MQEIKIVVGGEEYTLNNNSDKHSRAEREAGRGASPDVILAIYDRLGGLIKNSQGDNIENGAFWERYQRWKEEQPRFIKIIEDKGRSLEKGEKETIELISKNIDHKRAFLGTLMTISAAILAGLFILLTNNVLEQERFYFFAALSGFGFASFIIYSSIYLIFLLSQESLSLDKRLLFLRNSGDDFIGKVGVDIVDIDGYEKYRNEQYGKESKLKKEIKGSHEIWFMISGGLFFISCLPIFIMFWISILCK